MTKRKEPKMSARANNEVPYVAIDPGKEESSILKSKCQECGEPIEISFAELMRCAHDRHRERPACPNCGKRVSIGVAKASQPGNRRMGRGGLMQVEITAKTTDTPLSFIGFVAGISTGKSDLSPKRAKSCFKLGHMSVFEHVSATWRIEGISRACSHQLVRHRLASYCQQSQRYAKVETDSMDWYVIPPSIREDDMKCVEYEAAMHQCAKHYNSLLKRGVKPEDARFALPEATKTAIVATMNLREFASFYAARTDKAAQWEIRELAEEMMASLYYLGGEWMEITHMIEEVCDGG